MTAPTAAPPSAPPEELLRQLECRLEIDRPPAAVWPWICDPARQARWMKGFVSNEPHADGPTRPGSTFTMKLKEGGRVTDYEGLVVEHDEPRLVTLRLVGGCGKKPMTIHVRYRLTDLDGRTQLDYGAGVVAEGWFFKLLAPLFRVLGRKMARSMLATLKRGAEAEDA